MPRRKANESDKLFGKLIADLREASGKSQQQIAELANITYQQLGKYERGESAMTIGTYIDLRSIIGGSGFTGLAETQEIYQAQRQNLDDVEADLEAILEKVRKRNGR